MTADLAEARGPDVACSIEVPAAWFEAGATLQIQLPRLLQCARCEGGGCDACGRRGAFEQQAAGIAREVAVVLPTQPAASCAPVKLRLPQLGARAPEPEGVAGTEPEGTSPAVPEELEPAVAAQPEAAGEGAQAPEERPTAAAGGAALLAAARGDAPLALPAAVEPSAALEQPGAAAPPSAAALPSAAAPSAPAESRAPQEVPAARATEGPRGLPPGHLLLTIIPRQPEPGWNPPSNVQAIVLARPRRSSWEWLRPLELLLFPDRLAIELRAWWQTRAPAALRGRPAWIWAALAVVVTVLVVWLLTRSGSRSQ